MSEAAIIPKIPPVKEPDSKVVETAVPPKDNSSSASAEVSGKVGLVDGVNVTSKEPKVPDTVSTVPDNGPAFPDKGSAVPDANAAVSTGSTVAQDDAGLPDEPNGSITLFQGITYTSFILTFCLAGFAAVVVFRKALKASVKRFSIGAKVLSLAYLAIAFVGSFGTYIYSRFLNSGDTSFPLIIPMLSWILVGPAIAIVLNSLLTRDDEPGAKKILFDAFTYLVIFGCVAASQIPSLGAKEPLVFSFLGAVFFIVPIIRFSTSFKIAKVVHPELQEIFVQILIRSILFLPLLLPSLTFVNICEFISADLTLLLFNLVTLVFVLMTGLLMVISIDYITQGISADQLVAQKVAAPAGPSDPKPGKPNTPSVPPGEPTTLVSPAVPAAPESVPEKPVETKAETKPSAKPSAPIAPESSTSSAKSSIPFEESSETFEFDVEKDDFTVINFDIVKSSTEESLKVGITSEKSNLRPSKPKSKSGEKSTKSQLPKAPQSPNTSKPLDSKSRIKPPEKPKKRF